MWTRPAPCDVTFTSRWRQRSERIEPRTYSADASVDHMSTTPKRATTPLAPSVDPTEASYMPSDAGVVEKARRPIAVHRKSDLNRRRSGPSETIMSLSRLAQWGGDGARRRIESATLESVMSRGTPSTTALLRASMERPDSVAAGQLRASGDTEGSTGRRAVSGRSVSPGFNGPTPTGRPAAPPGGVGGRAPAPRRGTRSWAFGCGAGRVACRAPGRRSGRGSG
jgi:hypothetical protein